jgi:hypothetical protein
MATDIAFALGALALLGTRAPLALKVFLTALAIVDDLGAVLIIALFYTENIKVDALLYSLLFWGGMIAMNRLGVRNALIYFIVSLGLWYFMLKSGVHATVAGVLGAFAIPVRSRIDPELFIARVREYLNQFDQPVTERTIILSPEQQSAVEAIEREVAARAVAFAAAGASVALFRGVLRDACVCTGERGRCARRRGRAELDEPRDLGDCAGAARSASRWGLRSSRGWQFGWGWRSCRRESTSCILWASAFWRASASRWRCLSAGWRSAATS